MDGVTGTPDRRKVFSLHDNSVAASLLKRVS